MQPSTRWSRHERLFSAQFVEGTCGTGLAGPDRHIVRLRVNESHEGWILRSIQGREVTLLKGRKSDVLALAPPGGSSEPASTPGFSEPAQKAA